MAGYEGYFSVLAFPCNQFGDQEPEDAETVSDAMQKEYGLEFPIFNKIDVVGENASPAFRNLIGKCESPQIFFVICTNAYILSATSLK